MEKEFGKEIVSLVNGVTKLGKVKYRGRDATWKVSENFSWRWPTTCAPHHKARRPPAQYKKRSNTFRPKTKAHRDRDD